VQEAPGHVPSGRLPRSKNVILLNDLIDSARPGEEVEVTGVFLHGYESSLNAQSGFPVFATFIEANHVKSRADNFSLGSLTDDALLEIQKLARDRNIGERIMESIAPSIYGHTDIKACLALALFGGQEKHVGSHRLRCVEILSRYQGLISEQGTFASSKYV
jgi:DNA replication licensing factor MCM2